MLWLGLGRYVCSWCTRADMFEILEPWGWETSLRCESIASPVEVVQLYRGAHRNLPGGRPLQPGDSTLEIVGHVCHEEGLDLLREMSQLFRTQMQLTYGSKL